MEERLWMASRKQKSEREREREIERIAAMDDGLLAFIGGRLAGDERCRRRLTRARERYYGGVCKRPDEDTVRLALEHAINNLERYFGYRETDFTRLEVEKGVGR
jgi:hypothetical protein